MKQNCYLCIRIGITIFKIFICGGISLDAYSEIKFYGSTNVLPDRISDHTSPNEKNDNSYPVILLHCVNKKTLFTALCSHDKILHKY